MYIELHILLIDFDQSGRQKPKKKPKLVFDIENEVSKHKKLAPF